MQLNITINMQEGLKGFHAKSRFTENIRLLNLSSEDRGLQSSLASETDDFPRYRLARNYVGGDNQPAYA